MDQGGWRIGGSLIAERHFEKCPVDGGGWPILSRIDRLLPPVKVGSSGLGTLNSELRVTNEVKPVFYLSTESAAYKTSETQSTMH